MHVIAEVRKNEDFTTSRTGLTNRNKMFWLGNFEIKFFFIFEYIFLISQYFVPFSA